MNAELLTLKLSLKHANKILEDLVGKSRKAKSSVYAPQINTAQTRVDNLKIRINQEKQKR